MQERTCTHARDNLPSEAQRAALMLLQFQKRRPKTFLGKSSTTGVGLVEFEFQMITQQSNYGRDACSGICYPGLALLLDFPQHKNGQSCNQSEQ